MTPARRAALAALRQTLDRGQDIQAAVDHHLRDLAPRERPLATELTYGTVRLLGRIHALLQLQLPRFQRLSLLTRRLLELAAYELLFLRVPAHATRSWATQAAKALLGPKLAALVHASLRRLESHADLAHDEAAFLASAGSIWDWFSLPSWIWELWEQERGLDAARELAAMSLTPAPVGVRLRGQVPPDIARRLRPVARFDGQKGMALETWPQCLEAAEAQGIAVRMSLASQEAVLGLEPLCWPQPVWDACAGRGGKALLVHDLGKQVLASDPNAFRLRGLRNDCRRLGVDLPILQADARKPPLRIPPGTILVDAPCSGLGVLARRPDIRWKRTREDVEALARLQAEILDTAGGTLPPGGMLAYLTCTVSRQENEGQLDRLRAQHPQLRLRHCFMTPPQWGEVFFAALLERS